MDIAQISQHWSEIAVANSDGTIPACPAQLSEQETERRAVLDESLREVHSELERVPRRSIRWMDVE